MRDLLNLFLGTIQLKNETFVAVRDGGPAALRRAAALVALVALVAGVGVLFGGLRDAVRGNNPDRVRSDLLAPLDGFKQNPALPPEFKRNFVENYRSGIELGIAVSQLKTPLPFPLVSIIRGFGNWLRQPLVMAGSWLGYALAALVVARVLGGKASLPQMLNVTALSNAPYLLNLLGFIPYCGGAFTFVAWVWSTIIFVKGTAVANEMSTGKAFAAWLVPGVLVAAVWAVIVGAAIAFFAVMASRVR